MAKNQSRRLQKTTQYRTYGSAAYAPAYEEHAVSVPRRKEQTRTRTREKEQTLTRTKVRVRQAGEVSIFAVFGFTAVCMISALVLIGCVQLMQVSAGVSNLRSSIVEMQAENEILTAQYERTFDLRQMEANLAGNMVRPSQEQIVYIDLSGEDQVILYGQNEKNGGISGFLESVGNLITQASEYLN